MEIRTLAISGAFEVTPKQFRDDRGLFLETFRNDRLEQAIGHTFGLAQGNTSVSRRGVVRGIHYADVPPGQAKYVTCARGAILDYVVDVRVGSPTFGLWDSVRLDDIDRKAVYISEGLGHVFVALTDDATVTYMVSAVFNAEREHGISPLDPDINLVFPAEAGELLFSPKDAQAPSLRDALAAGALPTAVEIEEFRRTLATG